MAKSPSGTREFPLLIPVLGVKEIPVRGSPRIPAAKPAAIPVATPLPVPAAAQHKKKEPTPSPRKKTLRQKEPPSEEEEEDSSEGTGSIGEDSGSAEEVTPSKVRRPDTRSQKHSVGKNPLPLIFGATKASKRGSKAPQEEEGSSKKPRKK